MNKKLLTTILFTAVIFITYAQDITPTGGIKVSIFQGANTQERYDGELLHTTFTPENMVKIDLSLGAYIGKNLLVNGRIETYTVKSMDTPYFDPYQSDYFISMSYSFGDIVIGVEHACYHPVISNAREVQRAGGYNTAFIEWGF